MNEFEICEKYKSGLSLRNLSKLSSVSELKIKDILNRNNITINKEGGQRKYTLNESVFDNINDDSAYWIGMILTDGSITIKNCTPRNLNLGLKSEDKNHVKSFRHFLQSNQPIKEYTNDGYKKGSKITVFSTSSKKLVQKLSEYGIVPNKTPIVQAPFCLQNNKNFWRGVIDGDGWICTHNQKMPMLGLCGTETLVKQFQKYVLSITKTKATPRKNAKSEICWQYQFAGQPAQKIIENLYKDASVYMPRKMIKAQYWIDNPYFPKEPQWKKTVADFPEIAKQWHPTKNTLNPNQVAYGSTKNVWWLCDKEHEWQAKPNNRTNRNSQCPFCRN